MKLIPFTFLMAGVTLATSSCVVSKKKFTAIQTELATAKQDVANCENDAARLKSDK